MSTLYIREATGFREATTQDVITRAQALISMRFRTGTPALSAPGRTAAFLRVHLGALEYEVFGVLHLDTRHRLIAAEDIFRGTVDGATVHTREVVKSALAHNAAAVILYHNHPSGASDPSQADEMVTQRIRDALSLVEVRVLDHLIVGETVYSFAEHGLL